MTHVVKLCKLVGEKGWYQKGRTIASSLYLNSILFHLQLDELGMWCEILVEITLLVVRHQLTLFHHKLIFISLTMESTSHLPTCTDVHEHKYTCTCKYYWLLSNLLNCLYRNTLTCMSGILSTAVPAVADKMLAKCKFMVGYIDIESTLQEWLSFP